MKHDEFALEKECLDIARRHGWVCWKNEKNGNKGIPDDSLLNPDGRFFLIEFKKDEHQRLRPEQVLWSRRFPNIVHRIDSKVAFCDLLGIKG